MDVAVQEKTILCVEDEGALLEYICDELSDAGYSVLEARDGREGLKMILEHKPDMVISDITMPVMNGYELVETLRREHKHFADMPFLFLSALADRANIVEGMKMGVDDYLTKPVDYEILIAKVEAALERQDRINRKKEEEQIKLYNALTKAYAPDGRRRSWPAVPSRRIVLVGRSDQGLWPIQRFLEEIGHTVWVFTSGKAYLSKLEAGAVNADLTMLWHQSDDMQAQMIVRMMAIKTGKHVLVVPEKLYSPGMTLADRDFDHAIGLPVDEETLFKNINTWTSCDA